MNDTSDFVWKPWAEYAITGEPFNTVNPDNIPLPVTEPPCKFCVYWFPRRRFIKIGPDSWLYDGVTMCYNSDMENDFSCFRPNPRKTQSL